MGALTVAHSSMTVCPEAEGAVRKSTPKARLPERARAFTRDSLRTFFMVTSCAVSKTEVRDSIKQNRPGR
jgi:hypothetical protein